MKYFVANKVHFLTEQKCKNMIGGDAIVHKSFNIPQCNQCGGELLLFIQFDLSEFFELPFENNSHFVLFMCPKCNEIPTFESFQNGNLPPKFWTKTEGHFMAALFRPVEDEIIIKQKPILIPHKLNFSPMYDELKPIEEIRIGAEPYWFQDPEVYTCCCGEKMKFFCQIPENYGFTKQKDAPEQSDSFSEHEYCLFLGNEIYIFACPKQCTPNSVWITVQN